MCLVFMLGLKVQNHTKLPREKETCESLAYRGAVISWVKGFVCFVLKFAFPLRCKFPNKACADPINNFTPVYKFEFNTYHANCQDTPHYVSLCGEMSRLTLSEQVRVRKTRPWFQYIRFECTCRPFQGWQVSQTKPNWTCKIELIYLNRWSICQKPFAQNTDWPKSQFNKRAMAQYTSVDRAVYYCK